MIVPDRLCSGWGHHRTGEIWIWEAKRLAIGPNTDDQVRSAFPTPNLLLAEQREGHVFAGPPSRIA